ncbi:MAG: co-chaperone YbbN [Naasia sp.]|nr:co-chaperone YbbN [Naasia sp.]
MPSPASLGSLRGAIDLSPLVNRSTRPAGPGGAPGAPTGPPPGLSAGAPSAGAVAVPSLVLAASDATFAQVLEISSHVPVIVDLWAQWSEPSKELSPTLERVVSDYAGRVLLVTVDVDANPQLAQAFQAQSVPTVAAVLGGRPLGLFAGVLPEDQVRDVFEQVLVLAAQNGITGTAVVDGAPVDESAEPAEEPLPPHHAEAYAAIERGDYEAAIAEYRTAIARDPKDALAVAGLAQVSLLARLQDKTLDAIRSAAAAGPDNLDAQLDVADLDVSGGHLEDAFDRLLVLFPRLDPAGRTAVRTRLLEYFEIGGAEDPRVIAARRRLTNLLY